MRIVVVIKGGICTRLIADTDEIDVAVVDLDEDASDPVKSYTASPEIDDDIVEVVFTSSDQAIAQLNL